MQSWSNLDAEHEVELEASLAVEPKVTLRLASGKRSTRCILDHSVPVVCRKPMRA